MQTLLIVVMRGLPPGPVAPYQGDHPAVEGSSIGQHPSGYWMFRARFLLFGANPRRRRESCPSGVACQPAIDGGHARQRSKGTLAAQLQQALPDQIDLLAHTERRRIGAGPVQQPGDVLPASPGVLQEFELFRPVGRQPVVTQQVLLDAGRQLVNVPAQIAAALLSRRTQAANLRPRDIEQQGEVEALGQVGQGRARRRGARTKQVEGIQQRVVERLVLLW
ncbi:hypothetical protein D9M69_571330 [compost metagenome]